MSDSPVRSLVAAHLRPPHRKPGLMDTLELVLRGLREYGLLKGRHLGIDSSVIEANASLRELVHRNTEEQS